MRLFTIATSAQLISGYATAPSKQVFWNFLTDAESPVYLNSAQMNAISQAMSKSVPYKGDSFCGQLQDLNQMLRAGILSVAETDAIMREIQKHPVAFKNVASLMEVMEILEGDNLVNPGAGPATATWGDIFQTNPMPQDAINAAYLHIPKAHLYTLPFAIHDGVGGYSFPEPFFDPSWDPNIYQDIIVSAILAEGTITHSASYATQIWGAAGAPTVITAQGEAQTCVENTLGAPQIYKNIMYDYLSKVESVQNADLPQDFADWEALASSWDCLDETVLDYLPKGQRLACRVVNCIEDMSHVTFANPAGEVCDDIKACIMMTGDTESKEEFAAMCQRPDWKYGLNQVLTAVAVLDANPHNSLDDINSLFGCDNSCVFDNGYVINMYQQGVSVIDDTNCPTNMGLRSLEQFISDQANRKTGIITEGFIIPKMISSKNFKPFNNRGLETITEGPSVDSFHEIMSMATSGSSLDVWDAAMDESHAAYCTANQCLACLTDVQSKIVRTALPNGRTSSECVCPAAVQDHDRDGTADDLTTFIDYTELAQPIYAQVVLDYFTNWELAPADPSGDPGPEKFRPEELKWIAAALSDLPAPTGTSTSMPLSQAEYMTRTRGLVIKHLMQKIYEKGDLEFTTRVQGALDEDSFRHNMYFILETLYTAEQEMRWSPHYSGWPTADIDFSVLNNFHVESSGFTPYTPPHWGASDTATIDWTIWGNSGDSDLTEAYMDQILSGLNGGDPLNIVTDQFTMNVVNSAKGSYQEIFERTSELTDCANRDKVDYIEWICDERIDESVWQPCHSVGTDECWLAAGGYVCGIAEAAVDAQGPNTACPCDRTVETRCKEGAQLLTDESNWHNMRLFNPLYAAWGKQWMMDMAKLYSSDGSLVFSQAEMCALEQAIAEAMAVGAAGGENGVRNFEYNFAENVRNYINSDSGGFDFAFGDKVSDLIGIANNDGRKDELDWLIATAKDLSNGYGNDWKGDAINGEGHGSSQYFELYNLIHTMRNGGDWDVLGMPMGPDGNSFVGTVTEYNDGTGGNWDGFSAGDQDAWIATLNGDIMGMSWVADNQGPNNKYQGNYDQLFGYREPGPTHAPMYTTSRPNGCFGKSIGFCGIDPADLAHAICLMDEQLYMIENFFISKNVHPVMAQYIKDEAKQFLNDNAYNGYGQNPDMVDWFYGSLEELKYIMDLILGTVAYPIATDISNEQDFVTLLAQLQLMAEVGNPEFKHELSKEEFKNIDFNSVVTPGTTGQTFDPIHVFYELMINIEQATGEEIDPTLGAVIQAATDKTSTEGVTYFDNRTPGYTATTAVNTAPPPLATTEQPPVDDGLNAADCAGTVDYKFRSGKAKVSRSGENSNLVRLQQAKVKETKAHTGFVSFPKSACGKDFLAGLKDGRVTVDFADKKATYSVIGSYYVDNGSSTQVVVQYNSVPLNVADDKCPKCLGNSSTDQLEMLVMGTKNIEWGSKTAKSCLNGALVGHAGAAGAPTLLENDESGCVAWTNAL